MKRWIKKVEVMTLGFIIMLSGVLGTQLENVDRAKAATVIENVPIICYTTAYSNVNTYTTINGKYTGYICMGDRCTILRVYDSGWVYVSYPVRNGLKKAYAYSKDFFSNIDFSMVTTTTGKNMSVYRKADCKTLIGTVYGNDSIIIVGNSNGNTQIIYPLSSSGYKMGFVKGNISVKGQNLAPVVYNGNRAEIEALCFDATYYSNRYADLKAAYGYNQDALYNHWINYGIKEGRSASPILDLKYYIEHNNDLKSAFGTNYIKAYQHFWQYGYAEYRDSSPYYNGDYYRRKHTDLTSFDSMFLLKHYINYGIREGRYANTQRYSPAGVEEEKSDSFAALKSKYPSGSYWNGSYRNKAWQCHGFALTLGYERTGADPYGWQKVYNLNSLKPGDIIRCYKPHTIMVTGVSGNTISYVDCNWVAKNKVSWNQTIARSKITSKFGKLQYVMVSPW